MKPIPPNIQVAVVALSYLPCVSFMQAACIDNGGLGCVCLDLGMLVKLCCMLGRKHQTVLRN